MTNNNGDAASKTGYNRLLLLVSGLGGLLFGIDVGIVAGALPYLTDTSHFTASQLSFVVAAVLLGSAISTLFAGALADWIGRRALMKWSGLLFVVSIPIIALSPGFSSLVLGRLLQGLSGGLIGVVVPLYLAECLSSADRGKGTGIFQWLLTLGLMGAAIVGLYFSYRVADVAKLNDASLLFAFKNKAWRSIFWVSMPPGILFVIGCFFVTESPRWLFRRGKKDAARTALLRSRSESQTETELHEMEETLALESSQSPGSKAKESLLHRKYVIPFVLACIILACNQATGINSIIAYNATILIQSGLSDAQAHLGYVIFTTVNFIVTYIGTMLVDRKGRKFLLSVGSAGIIVSLIFVGIQFHQNEKQRVDVREAVSASIKPDQTLSLTFNQPAADEMLNTQGDAGKAISGKRTSLIVIYSYGGFRAATPVVQSDDFAAKPVEITRDSAVPANKVIAFFSNPFADLDAARTAPLEIDNALITPVPDTHNGNVTAALLYVYMAFFAIGPGICVWLALSELMPTRIRSNGMSIALLINQVVSTSIAAVFLPTVGKYGYATMFYAFAGCTVIYFITATFFLPETKGKTLEEIEEYFERGK